MTAGVTIPEDYRDLLERPLFADLATIRPDDTPQVNAMWFKWDGEYLLFTHLATRQKHRNVTHNRPWRSPSSTRTTRTGTSR